MATEEPSPIPSRDYLAVLRLRKWSILGIAALTLAAGLFFSLRQTPVYQSSTKILVKPFSSPLQSNSSSLVDMPTEEQIVSSDQVALLAVRKLNPAPSVRGLLDHLSVDNPAVTDVLNIGYSSSVPLRAQQGADAVSQAYLEYRTIQFRQSVQALEAPYVKEIARLTRQLGALNAKIQRSGGSPTPSQQAQQAQLNTQLAVARSQLVPIEAIPIDPGYVIQSASLPESPTSPKTRLNAAMALFVGLALGIGFAFLRDRFDDRVRDQRELEARSGAQVLTVVPRAKRWRKRDQTKLMTRDDRNSTIAEAFRLLRTGILFAAAQRDCRTILVTSPSPGEGKTTVSANLGVVLADAGKRVILISADLRKPRLHRFFGVRDKPGLVDVLSKTVPTGAALTDSGVEHLQVLPSGAMLSLHAELLASDAMGDLLRELGAMADFVVIDTPPVMAASDALTLAPLSDAVLLVVDARSSSGAAVTQVRQQLDQVGATLLGCVLNEFDPKRAGDRQYAYRYAYEYPSARTDESPNGQGPRALPTEKAPSDEEAGWTGGRSKS